MNCVILNKSIVATNCLYKTCEIRMLYIGVESRALLTCTEKSKHGLLLNLINFKQLTFSSTFIITVGCLVLYDL